MHAIEGLRLRARHVHALLRDDAESCRLNSLIDGARQVAAGNVGLEDREGALDGHGVIVSGRVVAESAAAYTGGLAGGQGARKSKLAGLRICRSSRQTRRGGQTK